MKSPDNLNSLKFAKLAVQSFIRLISQKTSKPSGYELRDLGNEDKEFLLFQTKGLGDTRKRQLCHYGFHPKVAFKKPLQGRY